MNDPCSLEAKPLLGVDEALAQILAAINPITTSYYESIYKLLGKVLAEDVHSPINLPFDRNAAMDGYAINSQDIRPDQDFNLDLVGTSWAGKPYEGEMQSGQCVRIFTGAVVPDGADTVVMQEVARQEGEHIIFPAATKPGQNVRGAGEDAKAGELLLPQGKQITPADLGLLTAAGLESVRVFADANVAYFSTGDELVDLGKPLSTGKIYDSNSHALGALLAGFPVDCVEMGVYEDDKRKLKNRIKRMAEVNHVIISTGGASVGEADYIQEVLAQLGEVKVWKIAVKPGKPLIFGKMGNCYYFGLPGNPVSMMLTFQQFVAPALNKLCGMTPARPLRLKATCTGELKKSKGRMEFQRGILRQDGNGNLSVESAGKQGSHILTTMSRSNCYIILPAESTGAKAGDSVLVEPFALTLPNGA